MTKSFNSQIREILGWVLDAQRGEEGCASGYVSDGNTGYVHSLGTVDIRPGLLSGNYVAFSLVETKKKRKKEEKEGGKRGRESEVKRGKAT